MNKREFIKWIPPVVVTVALPVHATTSEALPRASITGPRSVSTAEQPSVDASLSESLAAPEPEHFTATDPGDGPPQFMIDEAYCDLHPDICDKL